jgi:hypothetical protein
MNDHLWDEPRPSILMRLPRDNNVVPWQAASRMAERVIAECGAPNKVIDWPAPRLRYERLAKFDPGRLDEDHSIQFRSIATLASAFQPVALRATNAVFVSSNGASGTPSIHTAIPTSVKYALLGLMRSRAAEDATVKDMAGTAS